MLDMLEVSIAPPSIYTSLAMLTGYGWKRDQIEDAWGPPSLEVLLDAEGWDHADFDDYDYFVGLSPFFLPNISPFLPHR